MSAPEKTAKILIVDDEEQIRRALVSILSGRKYGIATAATGEEALDLAVDFAPDLVILDMMLPDMDGLDVCRELRRWYSAPVLILSVRGSDTDKIAGLDVGADDYLTKPFSAGELLARVRALLRRASSQVVEMPTVAVGDLEIDLARRRVRRGGSEIELTRIEFDILAFLARNADRVVTSKMILQTVWGPEYGGEIQTLRVHVSNLRKKIEPHPSVPRYIITEPGVGFCLKTS